MSLVDVDYIHEHCDRDASIILVDSSVRDMRTYPTPSEYTIEFNEPIKLVYGLNILDGMIPNTLYNNDTHNNRCCLAHVHAFDPSQAKSVLEHHIGRLQDNATFNKYIYYRGDSLTTSFSYSMVALSGALYDAWCANIVTPANMREPQPDAFVFFVGRVMDGVVAERVDNARLDAPLPAGKTVFVYNKVRWQVPTASVPSHLMHHLTSNAVAVDAQLRVVYYDVVWATSETGVAAAADALGVNRTSIEGQGAAYELSAGVVDFVWLEMVNLYIQPGNYEFIEEDTSLTFSYPVAIKAAYDAVQPVPYGDLTVGLDFKTTKLSFESTKPFVMLMGKSTCSKNMGMYHTVRNDSGFQLLQVGDDAKNFMSIGVDGDKFRVVPDGIVSLTSLPFIVLKFREIEEHVQRHFPVGKSGFGVFKLGGMTNDVAHLRFDFTNFVRKPFHPISKLCKLTIRFEQADGALYDFKGLDHMFILSVNYYVPRSSRPFRDFTLNPNYNPDYMTYLQDFYENKKRSEQAQAKQRIMPSLARFQELKRRNSLTSSSSDYSDRYGYGSDDSEGGEGDHDGAAAGGESS